MIEEQNNLLTKVDNFEYEIRLIEQLTKQYNDLKKELREVMVELGKDNNLEQIKWITPKGTKITCSIGHTAEIEKQKQMIFSEEKLKNEYPDIYEKCCEEKEVSVITKNATNDTLRITLPKVEENE